MEKFAIRFEKKRFVNHLVETKDLIENSTFENFDIKISRNAGDLRFLANLCKEQSLTTISRMSPYRELLKHANYVDGLVALALVDKDRKHFDYVRSTFLGSMTLFIDNVVLRFGGVTSQGKSVEEPSQETQQISVDNTHNLENELEDLNSKFNREVELIRQQLPKEPNVPVRVQGSVAVHQSFKNLSLNHSVIKSGGIKFSNSNKAESSTPITVLHNQTLLVLKLRPFKFHFRKEPLTPLEVYERKLQILEEVKVSNFIDADLDMSPYVAGGVLMSKVFKGYVFLWYMNKSNLQKLLNMPENKSYLMWNA